MHNRELNPDGHPPGTEPEHRSPEAGDLGIAAADAAPFPVVPVAVWAVEGVLGD
jgi:hypothetical protein